MQAAAILRQSFSECLLLHHALVLVLAAEKEKMAEKRQEIGETQERGIWIFQACSTVKSLPTHGSFTPSSTAYWDKGHMENDSPLRARLPT